MGYDILLYCVKALENDKTYYRQVEDAPTFLSRAYTVQAPFGVSGSRPEIFADVWIDWLLGDVPPEGMLNREEVYVIQGTITEDFLYEPESILNSVNTLEKSILEHDDFLPSWYNFKVHRFRIEEPENYKYNREVWAIVEGQTWFFDSDWDVCIAYQRNIPDEPQPNPSPREITSFLNLANSSETVGYVFGLRGFGGLSDEYEKALERLHKGQDKDTIEVCRKSYYNFYAWVFRDLKAVCHYALEHQSKIFVYHHI